MAKPKGSAVFTVPTKWEASCLFCGEGIVDEGEGFLIHMAGKQACHDQYDSWIANLGGDWGGGD